MLEEVKALRSREVSKELVKRAPLSHVKKVLPLQPINSREMLLEKAWKCLAENECWTLGLYGIAGVGKTTLLTRIKNKFIEDGYLSGSLVLFVVVDSEEVEGIQVAIMERLGLYMGRKDKEEKAFEIYENLKVKRFVLLLDDIQRKVDLEEIGVPLPSRENGSKIVFTTRSREACGSKWVDVVEEVKCLSPEEAWNLFQEIVGETTLTSHRLIHLDLDDTPRLREIDVIGYLLNLQVLRLFRSVPIDLSLMEDIQLMKSLRDLSLTAREVDVVNRLLSNHRLASCIGRLHLTEITIADGGILLLNSMLSLRELDVGKCGIKEITVNWRSTIQKETVHFGNIEKIPHIQNIRTVTLSRCRGLKDLTWLLLAPNLGDLRLHNCWQIEHIISKEKATADMSEQPFQNLTRLSLEGLPELESIYWAPLPFPVLEYLYIRGCPKLRRLPFNSVSAKGIQVRSDLDQEWIDGVEWENEDTKQYFSGFDNRRESHPVEDMIDTHTPVEKPRLYSLVSTMKCFFFSSGDKKDEQKTPKSVSLTSNFSDRDINRSGSEFNSRDVSGTSTESSMGRKNSYPPMSTNLREFSITDLKSATKNFSRSVMIGEGGFGCVFRGTVRSLEDPSIKIEVAVKQLGKRGLQGHKEWATEVNFLGMVEHSNLVKLLGYCAEDDGREIQRLLVYEYMPNRSVEFHLSPRSLTILTWDLRLRIAQDAARGLTYLHEQMDFQIIFRDLKSSNILLDEEWKAKLSDFGLARLGPSEGLTHVSTDVVGTMGYAAPEYIQTGRLTSKSDVWGYGVFIYELITGRRPVDGNKPKGEQKLLEWVRPHLTDTRKFKLILDPRLEAKYPLKSVQKLAVVANMCLHRNPKARPKMSEVLKMVTKIVEAPSGSGTSPQLVPLKNLETSRDAGGKNKRVLETGTTVAKEVGLASYGTQTQ